MRLPPDDTETRARFPAHQRTHEFVGIWSYPELQWLARSI
jgi:hypothetical protein